MVVMVAAFVFSLLFVVYIARKYIWPGKTPPPQAKLPPPTTSPTTTRRYEFDTTTDLLKEISTKWQKPYHTLPVHVDIPRLAKKIVIYGDGQVVHKAQEDDTCNISSGNLLDLTRQDSTIKEIILTLSKWLGDPQEQQESISTKYSSFFGSGDPSLSLNEFIEQVVGVDSNVVKVLKACNQSILAPGVLVSMFSRATFFLSFLHAHTIVMVLHHGSELTFVCRNSKLLWATSSHSKMCGAHGGLKSK